MRVYRTLLRLYPASFRREYGREMCAVFASERRDASGPLAVAALWVRAAADIVVNAVRVHLEILRGDLRYAARRAGAAPGFTLTVIAVAALGIGATTAAFSIANHVFLRPLPFPGSDRLVQLWQDESGRGISRMELSPANYRDWKARSTSFEAMGVYTNRAANLTGAGEPQRLDGALVTWDLFAVLQVQPALGRPFSEADDRPGAAGTVILSDGLWRAMFGGDPSVLGRTVTLDGHPLEVIGVMPRAFRFPHRTTEFWAALRLPPDAFEDRTDTYIYPVARLRPGVTVDRARAEVQAIAAQLAREFPDTNRRTGAYLHLLRDQVSDRSRLMLLALAGGSLCVLLIACTNLAHLLLARSLARGREVAVRMALGAGADRLVRQMLTESLALAACGGVAGVALAAVASPLAAALVPTTLPIGDVPPLDARVLLCAALVTAATALGFGLVPALAVRRDEGMPALRDGARAGTGRGARRLRSALVVAEVTACVVLLVTAGLLVRALWRVQQIDPGFRAEGVLTLRTALPLPEYAPTARRQQFYDRVIGEVERLPGVSRAAYISALPMVWRGGIWPVTPDGQAPDPSSRHLASLRQVTPGLFDALGIPLVEGRDLQLSDTRDSPFVAVVSESFARVHWPDEDPIGRVFHVAFFERTVVGVVGDVRVRGLERSDSEPQVYIPSPQVPDGGISGYAPKDLVIKAGVPPASLIPAVRRIIAEADPRQPISDLRPLADVVAGETASRQVQLRALSVFAAAAVVLAALGIHGLLAFGVSARLREFGVRRALGAQTGAIVGMVVRQGLVLALAGTLLGAAAAWAAGRWLESLLAGVSPSDPLTFAAAAAIVLLVAATGSAFPALRAMRVDPAAALRSE